MNATSGMSGITQPRLSALTWRGRLAEPVAQDREVVRAEVPGDADVRLVQAEVHAARRDEVDLAELAASRSARGSRSPAGCRGTCGPASARGRARRRARSARSASSRGRRERLLDEDVLAGVERRARERDSASRPASRSRPRRRRRRRATSSNERRGRDGRIAPRRSCSSASVAQVADHDELGVRQLVEVADEVRAPVAEADDRDARPARSAGQLRAHARRRPLRRRTASGVRQSRREVEAERPAARVGDVHVERLAEGRRAPARSPARGR